MKKHTSATIDGQTSFCGIKYKANSAWLEVDCLKCLKKLLIYKDDYVKKYHTGAHEKYDLPYVLKCFDEINDNYKRLKYKKDFNKMIGDK